MRILPSRPLSLWSVLGIGLLLATATDAASKPVPKPASKTFSLSSARGWLKQANDSRYCVNVEDAFDRRKCERNLAVFRGKMWAWARAATFVDDVEVEFSEYDFSRRAYTMSTTTEPMGNDESDFSDVEGIGSQRCDRETEQPVISQRWPIPMPVAAAENSPLRQAAGRQTVTAVLKFTGENLMWCCGPVMRRGAQLAHERCSIPAILLRITGWEWTDGADDRAGDDDAAQAPAALFKAGVTVPPEVADFDVRVLGCLVPTGDGEFGPPDAPKEDDKDSEGDGEKSESSDGP